MNFFFFLVLFWQEKDTSFIDSFIVKLISLSLFLCLCRQKFYGLGEWKACFLVGFLAWEAKIGTFLLLISY